MTSKTPALNRNSNMLRFVIGGVLYTLCTTVFEDAFCWVWWKW